MGSYHLLLQKKKNFFLILQANFDFLKFFLTVTFGFGVAIWQKCCF